MTSEQQTRSEVPPTGRQRLLAALKKPPSRGQLTAAVLLAVLGFAAVVQVQAHGGDDQYAGLRQEDLIQLLNSLAAASERAENEIAQLEETRNSLRSDTEAGRTALERAREQVGALGILAGTVPAVGPGVRITVKDPKGAVSTDHLVNGLEELRDAGAEAIEINDKVRVVAQTYISDAEQGLVVDGQVVRAPYTIDAIGDSHTLAEALDFTGGFVYEIEQPGVGGRVTIDELDTVEVESTRPATSSRYAERVPAE